MKTNALEKRFKAREKRGKVLLTWEHLMAYHQEPVKPYSGPRLVACPNPIGYFQVAHDGGKIPMPCNRWDCPFCGQRKKWRVAQRVMRGFGREMLAGNRVRALTLTQKLGTSIYIMDAWRRFRALLAKRGYHLTYFWAKEFTKQGERHIHALINAYIPQPVIQDCWRTATKGESYIVWITGKDIPHEDGDIYNPAGYATKYLTKSYGTEARFDKGERRFGFSRNPLFRVRKTFGPSQIKYAAIVTTFSRRPLRYTGSWRLSDVSSNLCPLIFNVIT